MASGNRERTALAHDLRNLLAIILGYCDVLLQEIPANEPHHIDVAEIRRAAEQARDLLERWARTEPTEQGS